MMVLKDQCAIISGASRGLGFAIAEAFVAAGANIFICARDASRLQSAQSKLQHLNRRIVGAAVVDISKPEAVENLINQANATMGRIDILVANAAINGVKGHLESIDWEAWSETIDINLKGTVLQCRAVLPHFKKQQHGKILILSGGGATKPLPLQTAYAASKAGVVRFAETLAEEVTDFGIDVNSIAPGAMNTDMLKEILAAGPEKVGTAFYQQALLQKKTGGDSLETAANLCVFLASPASNGIRGKLISAVWDEWETFEQKKKLLQQSDIFTLRRIVPQDRALDWENN